MADIEIIREQLDKIDSEMAELRKKRTAVLRSDAEYAEYLDRFTVERDVDPLTIFEYYQYCERLEQTNRRLLAEMEDRGSPSLNTLKELAGLEFWLAA